MPRRIKYPGVKDEDLEYFGVYQIKNTINKRSYIGSTTSSFRERFQYHRKSLIDKKHANKYLQKDWNEYGENAFKFKILVKCHSKEQVRDLEQEYINKFNFDMLYNICSNSRTTEGVIQTEDQIMKKVKRYVIVTPENEIYKISNLRKFCRDYNLPQWHFDNIANRKEKIYKGWLCYHAENFSIELLKDDREKLKKRKFIFISFDGTVFKPDDLKKFCEERNLCITSVFRAAKDNKIYRGWRIVTYYK